MSKTKKPPQPSPPAPRKGLTVNLVRGEDVDETGKRIGSQITAPEMAAHRIIAAVEEKHSFGDIIDAPGMLAALRDHAKAVNGGDLSRAEAMLMAQATALQSIFARMIERGLAQEWLPQFETFVRLGLKAQAQCRATLEALAEIKHGPAIFARQANLSGGGPIQVNNGLPSGAGARQTENPPNQLSGPTHELRPDTGASAGAVASDPAMETVGGVHRPQNG